MEQIEKVCRLLEKKRELFLQYEQATEQITVGSAETIPGCMEERLRLQQEIDLLNQELETLCEGETLLLEAAKNHVSRGDLPEELRLVFDRGMAIRSVVSRIQEQEPLAVERMTQERDSLLSQIKSMNQGAEAVASKYYRSTVPQSSEERRTFKKV